MANVKEVPYDAFKEELEAANGGLSMEGSEAELERILKAEGIDPANIGSALKEDNAGFTSKNDPALDTSTNYKKPEDLPSAYKTTPDQEYGATRAARQLDQMKGMEQGGLEAITNTSDFRAQKRELTTKLRDFRKQLTEQYREATKAGREMYRATMKDVREKLYDLKTKGPEAVKKIMNEAYQTMQGMSAQPQPAYVAGPGMYKGGPK